MEWLAAFYGAIFGVVVTLALVEVFRELSKPVRVRSREEMEYLRAQARREGRYVEP